jgi:hypothetical protein
MSSDYPVYPSVKVAVPPCRYSAASKKLLQSEMPNFFFDGDTILVPENNLLAIELLKDSFSGEVIEVGWGREYEYATLAKAVGVSDSLVSLGNAVWNLTGQTANEMIQFALSNPSEAYLTWKKIYLEAMD